MSLEKEFVLYEQALYLKELGFNEPCLSRYCIVTEWEVPTGKILFQLLDCELNEKNLIKAPTLSQAFRWFREKYGYFTSPTESDDDISKKYDWLISKNLGEGKMFIQFIGYRDSYEEAELECLKKLISIIKESKDGNN